MPPTWNIFPEIPNVGNLNTTSTTSLPTKASETLTNDVSLHKISKTGSYNDLLRVPVYNSVGSEEGPVILSSLSDGTYSITGEYKSNPTTTTVLKAESPMIVNKAGNTLTLINNATMNISMHISF